MTDESIDKSADGQPDAPPGRIKVLVIEDSSQMNLLYGRGLPDTVFEKRFAQDGTEGLMIYEDWRPDIIVLDVMLPGITGYSVLKRIRKTHKDTATTIIISTSLSKKEDVTAMMRLGIQGYVVKPFNIRDIGGRILKYYEKVNPSVVAANIERYKEFLEELTGAAKAKVPAEKIDKSKDGKSQPARKKKEDKGDDASTP